MAKLESFVAPVHADVDEMVGKWAWFVKLDAETVGQGFAASEADAKAAAKECADEVEAAVSETYEAYHYTDALGGQYPEPLLVLTSHSEAEAKNAVSRHGGYVRRLSDGAQWSPGDGMHAQEGWVRFTDDGRMVSV